MLTGPDTKTKLLRETIWVRSTGSSTMRSLVVMLPGLNLAARDFIDQGFAADLQARHPASDVVALSIGSTDYFGRGFVEALRDEIIAPARGRYAKLTVLGISLGAMGALLYAQNHADDIDDLVLLAPFIGNPGTIAEVERAGGLEAWTPSALRPWDIERPLLLWLKAYGDRKVKKPRILLGFGAQDRFADGAKLLASILPKDCVTMTDGAHDWQTWHALWQAILDQGWGGGCR